VSGSLITLLIDLKNKKFLIKCNTKKIDMVSKINEKGDFKLYDDYMLEKYYNSLIEDFQ